MEGLHFVSAIEWWKAKRTRRRLWSGRLWHIVVAGFLAFAWLAWPAFFIVIFVAAVAIVAVAVASMLAAVVIAMSALVVVVATIAAASTLPAAVNIDTGVEGL